MKIRDTGNAIVLEEDEIYGHLDYIIEGNIIDARHTVVDSRHQGKGYAKILYQALIEKCKKESLLIKPTCWYIEKCLQNSEKDMKFHYKNQ